MSIDGSPPTEKELKEIEAWRDEVAKANEDERLRPRRSIRGMGARALATETQATVPIEEPEST